MYLNNIELDNNTLTDNDLDTCVTLGGSQGCITDKVGEDSRFSQIQRLHSKITSLLRKSADQNVSSNLMGKPSFKALSTLFYLILQ